MADGDFLKALLELLFGSPTTENIRVNTTKGAIEIQCPVCENWCEALVHEPGLVAADVTTDNASLVELRLTPTFCVHRHECPATADVVKDFVQTFKERRGD